MNILLLGKDGQVGQALQRSLSPLANVIALGRSEADLSQPKKLADVLASLPAEVIVNAAAYTAVDRAESEWSSARLVNGDSVAVLAQHAAKVGAVLVHYSTDYVFDGSGTRPWTEDDVPAPINAYGRSKREGEIAVSTAGGRHLIFRTSWLHSAGGHNFPKTILELAQLRPAIRIVTDQIGAPTRADLVAEVTAAAVSAISANRVPPSGLYHLSASGETNWFEYAQLVVEEAEKLGIRLLCDRENVSAITSMDYVTPAPRPLNSRLDTTKLVRQFGLTMPHWRDGVIRTVHEIVSKWR